MFSAPKSLLLLTTAFSLVACAKQKPPTQPPVATITDPADEVEEPAPPPEPIRRVGDESVAVGTFNLQWAHDPLGEQPELAQRYRAQSEDDWEWKVEQVAKLLVESKLDVVALQELGGESEVSDIVLKVEELGGPSYDWAFQESTDSIAGHHVAILSRYPISDARRLDIHMRRHLVADVELPRGGKVTFIAFHARGGTYASNEKSRTKQAKALKRQVASLQEDHPVVILGTANTPHTPETRGYGSSSVGVLAGRQTRQDTDDCFDSGAFWRGQSTTVHGDLADRIFSCGLEIVEVELDGEPDIVRDEVDPDNQVWSQVPVEDAPYRDVSDHLVLWAEIALPKPAAEGGGETTAASP